MAVYALNSPEVFIGAYDASCDLFSITGSIITNDLDTTTFCSGGWHTRIAGLHDVDLEIDGYTNLGLGNEEATIFPQLGTTNQVVSIPMVDGTQQTDVLMFKALSVGYSQPTKVGDVAQFKVPLKGSGVAVEGFVGLPKQTVVSSSSSGTYMNLGAVGATQYLYGTQHITSFIGSATTSITTVIKSATNSSGLGATTRLTFTAQTTASAEFAARVSGPITDTFWGVTYTITSTTASITDFVAIGIQ